MKKIIYFIIITQLITSCNKHEKFENDVSTNTVQSSSKQLSNSEDFKVFVRNLEKLKSLALLSAKKNSYFYNNDLNKSTFLYSLNRVSINNIDSIKEKLNSQFYKGEEIASLLFNNFELSKKIKKEFPEILNLESPKRSKEISVAIEIVLNNYSNNLGKAPDGPKSKCQKACENQYYISAGVCALLVETVWGAIVCYIGACAGLDACLRGC